MPWCWPCLLYTSFAFCSLDSCIAKAELFGLFLQLACRHSASSFRKDLKQKLLAVLPLRARLGRGGLLDKVPVTLPCRALPDDLAALIYGEKHGLLKLRIVVLLVGQVANALKMCIRDRSYHDYILDQFRLAEGISTRKMMGEYVLYVQGRVMGGLYDDRLIVKPTAAARALLRCV